MAGTKDGGKHAANTNKQRHGKDFYKRIGSKGGAKSRGGGFSANRELARKAGAKGGRISRRGKARKLNLDEDDAMYDDWTGEWTT